MPLTRYRVRSEYGLADPELYKAADKDDPEALLEGVAMAGLVGVLRQLGDLAEFAAEIFHDLHEEVLATAARGHGLIARVQQLEVEFPPIEKALLSQTNQSLFHYNAGVDWHPNLRSEQNLIAGGDLPRFVMDSYEESRGPPRLFLLDKFDVAGAGSCLKRYTDPSFFKVEAAASGKENLEIHREKKNRRFKKKGMRWRNGETTPEVLPASHTKLEQLFLEERVENGHSDPARLVKLKRRHLNGSVVDPRTGKSYMEKFAETPEERELACETSIVPVSFTPEYTSESGIRILDISTVSSGEKSLRSESAHSSPNVHEKVSKASTNGYGDEEIIKEPDTSANDGTSERSSSLHEVQVERQVMIYGEGKRKVSVNGYESDDMASEVENYMDAVASIESEMETDNEYRPNRTMQFLKSENRGTDSEANEEHIECRAQLSDTQSVGNFSTSDEGHYSFKRYRSSFSYSDSPNSLAENTIGDSDQGATVPSAEFRGSAIMNDSNNELVVSPDSSVKEQNIYNNKKASGSEMFEDTQQHEVPAESLSAESLVGPETGENLTEYIKPDHRVQNIIENDTSLFNAEAVEPQVSSQISADITDTPGRYPVDESEAEEQKVFSGSVLHMPNVSELASQNEDKHVNEEFEVKEELTVSNKSLDNDENETHGTLAEQPFAPSLPNSGTTLPWYPVCRNRLDVLEPDDIVSGEDDSVSPTGVRTEDTTPTLVAEKNHIPDDGNQEDSLPIIGLEETHFSDFSEDVPHDESVSAKASVPPPKESPNSEDSGVGDFEETSSSTSHGNSLPSDVICSPLETPNLPEPFAGTLVSHQKEAEFPPECDVESETPREACDPELDSADSGSTTTSVSTSYRHSGQDNCDENDDSLPVENTTLRSFPVIDNTETSTSMDDRGQGSESLSLTSHQPETEGSPNLPADQASPEIDKADLQQLQVQSDQPDADHLEEDQSRMDPPSDEQIAIQKDASSNLSQEDQTSKKSTILQSSSESADLENDIMNQASDPFEFVIPNTVLVPEAAQVDLAEMPPLPPLPPMQWRMGLGTGMGMGMGFGMGMGIGNQGLYPPIQSSMADEKADIELPVSQTTSQQSQSPNFALEVAEPEKLPFIVEPVVVAKAIERPEEEEEEAEQSESISFAPAQTAQLEEAEQSDSVSPAPPQTSQCEEAEQSESSSFAPHIPEPEITQTRDVLKETNQPPSQLAPEASLDATTHQESLQSPERERGSSVVIPAPPLIAAAQEKAPLGLIMPIIMPIGDLRWSSNKSGAVSESEPEKENGNLVPKIPRPRNPLIDEVNAHGTSKLRKVAERVLPRIGPKADERDSLLEQIRTKSFNLKPTTATRPSIGPTFKQTNLRVAAILEKANAIRQSLAGSDDDEDDDDNWD